MAENKKRLRADVANAHTQQRIRFPFFWVILLAFVIVSAICISGVLKNVNAFLEEYESVQPKYVEAEVFDTYFKKIYCRF